MAIYIWWQPYYIIHGFDYYWIKWHIRKEKKANDNQSQVRWLIDSNCLTSFKIDRLFFLFCFSPFFCPTEWGKKTKPTVFGIMDLNIYLLFLLLPIQHEFQFTMQWERNENSINQHFSFHISWIISKWWSFVWEAEKKILFLRKTHTEIHWPTTKFLPYYDCSIYKHNHTKWTCRFDTNDLWNIYFFFFPTNI